MHYSKIEYYNLMKKLYIVLILILTSSYTLFAQKDYEGFVKDALDYTEKRDFAAAEQSYKAALRKEPANPSNVMLLMNLGTMQRYLGKFEEALISYNVVVQKYPTLSHILMSRALLYCDMNRYEDALKDYNTVILHKPDDKEALYERGLLHISLRNLDAAEGDFKTILSLDEKNPKAQTGIAMIFKRRGDWKEAELLYTDLIAKDKKNGELYANRAECYLYLKKLRSMSDDLDKALEYGYDDVSVTVLKGQLRLAQFDKAAAKVEFLKAKELGANAELIDEFLKLCK